MAFLKLGETLDSEMKIESDPETRDRVLDLKPGTIHALNNLVPGMWLFPRNLEHCCIYRVPSRLRRVNPEEYTPQSLIIGPLHHSLKSQALKFLGDITNTKSMDYLNMEQHKKIYLAEFARRFKGEQIINEFRRIIEEDEEIIRASYSESTAWIESPQLLDMILHDSVFIIEFLLRSFYERSEKTGDPIMDDPCLKSTVEHDLLLLENQLPYFILEKLFDPIVPILVPDQTFRELVIKQFVGRGKINNSKFRHFTDLFRLVHVETLPKFARRNCYRIEYMYTSRKLYSGGVKFEPVKEEFSLNVRFENGCLKIPCLSIGYKVEMRLRNLMALEQCHYKDNAYVCNYVLFLDHIIDTRKDVKFLVEKGIIINWMGEDIWVAKMVNRLGLGIICNGSYYSDIALEVNAYFNNPINRSRSLLKRVYFGNLWTGTATVAATFLLVMSLIQTVASIIEAMQN